MDTQSFKASISPESRKHIAKLYKTARKHRELLYKIAALELMEHQAPLFERFVYTEGFALYARSRLHISLSRMEETLHILLRRIALEISPEKVGKIAYFMSMEIYFNVEKSFFLVPVDRDAYRLFEKAFISLGEQNDAVLEFFLEFCGSYFFVDFKDRYRSDLPLYTELFTRLSSFLLAVKSQQRLNDAVGFLVNRHVVRFFYMARDIDAWQDFTVNIFNLFLHHPNPSFFLELLALYSKRYPHKKGADGKEKEGAFLFRRLMRVWNYLWILGPEKKEEFKSFLDIYGHPREDFSTFVWDTVFELEPERAVKGVAIFTSLAFTSIRGFYGQDTSSLKFLIKNIIVVLSEIEIKDISTSLYRIVLKLLLGQKVDRNYLKRRAEFFQWLKTKTSSVRLELEVIRFLLFEYIFIALKQVKNTYGMKMDRFCDEIHRYYCQQIDHVYSNKFLMRTTETDTVFQPVLDLLRDNVWRPAREKFAENIALLNEIISVAESIDREDEALMALESVEAGELEHYHESFMDTFRSDPERMEEAIVPDFWYRISLGQALPHILSVTVPLAGMLKILPGGMGAYTDGHTIHLPEYMNFFKDPLDPLVDNRNITLYVGMAIHETGHILGGSFVFNLDYYSQKLEMPDLFRTIMNVFEDFRVEAFMIRIKAHYQVEEIIPAMNRFLLSLLIEKIEGLGPLFLQHVFMEANGYNDVVKESEVYSEKLSLLYRANLNTGRFRSIREMSEYAIERLKHLDIANPLSTYELSREMYEIMRHWPETELEGLLDPEFIVTGRHSFHGDDGSSRTSPLTREELKELYREYDENPRAFLERYNIPIFPELLPAESGKMGEADASNRHQTRIEEYVGMIMESSPAHDFSSPGTIDFFRRTKSDDAVAERQVSNREDEPEHGKKARDEKKQRKKKKGGDKKKKAKKSKEPQKFVYSIDPRTRSRTRLSEVKEFTVKNVSPYYFRRFRKWEYLAQKVYRELAILMPSVKEEYDTSSTEGEINMDLLIEVLSNRQHFHSFEFLDIFTETRRSLKVIIGLDASYSTSLWVQPYRGSMDGATVANIDGITLFDPHLSQEEALEYDTILDIEKAFAIILGRALSCITEDVTIMAFNSVTATNVYRAETIEAVSSFVEDAANRDGDFIRYARQLFEQSDAEVKYFFLLSDGRPDADNYKGKEALDDTLIAMRETVNAGIRLIYFNVDLTRGDYFEIFKREATYAEYFNNPEQILPAIPELVRKVVATVK